MNKFEINVNEANDLMSKVWDDHFDYIPHKNFLEGWSKVKNEYLAKLFGGELILKKEIVVNQDYHAMYDDIRFFKNQLLRDIEAEDWCDTEGEGMYSYSKTWYALREWLSTEALYNNKSEETYTFNGKKILKGSKITKALKIVLSDPKKVEEHQVKYSQLMNTKTLKGTLCLSIHPLDFLTMSHTSSWGSCYDAFNEGEYCSGTLEYLFSNNTIVAYLTTKDMGLSCNVRWNDKKWRSIFSVSPGEYLMSGKNYPYQSSELTEKVYEWINELMNNQYVDFKEADNLCDVESWCVDVCYGYNDTDYDAGKFMLGMPKGEDIEETYVTVSYGEVICPKCGGENEYYSEGVLVCGECDDHFHCDECGDTYNQDSYTVYDRCGYEIQVCYYCLDNNYLYCENCEEYHHYENTITTEDGYVYCNDCLSSAFKCDCCGEWFSEYCTEKEYKGKTLCEDCYDEKIKEEEEEEEKEED